MKARSIAAILLGLFAILTLVDRFVLVELVLRRVALPLLFAAAVALACIAIGRLARGGDAVDAPLDLLVGYPLFGALCYLVGLANVSMATMLPLAGIGAIAGALLLLIGRTPQTLPPIHWSLFAVVAVLACGFVVAQAPPSSLDELAYHLAIPRAWVLEGRAIDLPLLSHSYFPLGIESADLPALTLFSATDAGIASHLLHLFAAIATTLLVARRSGSWLVAAAIATTPAIAVTTGWSLVDWPLVGLFVVLWVAVEDDDLRLASAVTAAGLLVKYTFIPFALAGWVILLIRRRREGRTFVPHWIVLAGAVFFIRNLVHAGNPIAPFLSAGAPQVVNYRSVALADYVFEGAFVDEALGASLIIVPVFATGALAVASVLLAVAFFLLAPSSRLLVPYLAVASLPAAEALRRRSIAALVAIAVVAQTFFVVWFTARGGAFSLLAGGASEEQYLAKQRPSSAAIAWINQRLPKNSKTLAIGIQETYWFDHAVRGGGNFDGERISRYLATPTPEALRARLRRDGITHVAVVATPVPTTDEGKRAERETALTPAAQRMLSQMLDREAVSVVSRADATLFTLR